MNNQEAIALIKKYNASQCTAAEKALLEDWYLQFNEQGIDISPERIEEIRIQILAELPGHQKTISLWPRVAAVAAVVLLAIGSWHFFAKTIVPQPQIYTQEIAPGGNKAVLTLASGKVIPLNDAKDGLRINGNQLSYLDGTAIAENVNGQGVSVGLQTLATPKGGQYQILLPDGTKVWLNAASSLKYPNSFASQNQRIVELSGEAFFEVAPNQLKPFLVKTAKQTVTVLGTHFNINSYNDEGSTITTLEEGSVKVDNLSEHVILKPGQQSLSSTKKLNVQEADLEVDLAWKNNRIEFKDASLAAIMKQVARWYNIEVEYKGTITERTFTGSLSRQSNLSVLLKILAYSDIHFVVIQNPDHTKKLIVTP